MSLSSELGGRLDMLNSKNLKCTPRTDAFQEAGTWMRSTMRFVLVAIM